MTLLERIDSPADLKALSPEEASSTRATLSLAMDRVMRWMATRRR
jgi:hypothetical protein